jgi:clathrin heavy chain
MSAPNVAEGIFQLNLFTHYDKDRVGKMCEQVGLYGRALQNTVSVEDCKRIILNSHAINKDVMIEFFGKLNEEDTITCLNELLKTNRQNGQLCAEIAIKYASKIDSKKIITILEQYGT